MCHNNIIINSTLNHFCLVNKDIILLILEKLQDQKSLYSCLFVDKTWCRIVISILWKNIRIENNSRKKRSSI